MNFPVCTIPAFCLHPFTEKILSPYCHKKYEKSLRNTVFYRRKHYFCILNIRPAPAPASQSAAPNTSHGRLAGILHRWAA